MNRMSVMLLIAPVFAPQAALAPAEVVNALHAAMANGDGDAVLAQLASDVVIFESGGAEMSRDEYASHHLGGDLQFAAATDHEILEQSSVISGELAYVLTRSRTTGALRERQIDSLGVETMVLQRRDAGWQIIHVHWSSRRAPEQ